jgi:hypothetical protein
VFVKAKGSTRHESDSLVTGLVSSCSVKLRPPVRDGQLVDPNANRISSRLVVAVLIIVSIDVCRHQ